MSPAGQRLASGRARGTPIGTLKLPWGDVEWLRYAAGMLVPDVSGGPEYAPMWAGVSCSVVNDVKPASEIVRDLVRGAEESLTR
ncbi:MAG TPA: hypothetical protein VFR38_16385 [Gaiellaceae bacterium]|nr:hypothetical protein [Gaiellaceae bacterium]